jgi:thioesterase domain-containing protein
VVLKDEGRGKERGQRSWELREYVRSRLPEYMVPAAVVELEQIPLTANGKLDRKALPSATDEDVRDVNESAPRDSTEVQLLQLWKEVLGLENIGITDNFFALGGHSLTAVSLAARLSSVDEERITVRSVFEFPTIALMSSFVRQEVAYAPPTTVIPIQPKGHRTPIFCVHPAQGMPHCYLALARHLGPDQPFYAMQSYGLEEGQLPYSDVESMAARYIEDMRKIQPSGPYQLGGWSLGGIIAYEMAQQLHASGEKIGMLVMLEAHSYSQQVDAPLTEEQFLLQKRNFLLNHLASDFGVRIEDQAVSLDSIAEMYFLRAKDSGQVPTDVTMEQFQRLLLVTIMNRHAARKYIPRPYPGSLTLFRSTTSRHTKDDYGWRTLVMGKVDVHCLDAEHNEFVMEPNAAPLARSLAARMSEDTESVFSPDPLGAIS